MLDRQGKTKMQKYDDIIIQDNTEEIKSLERKIVTLEKERDKLATSFRFGEFRFLNQHEFKTKKQKYEIAKNQLFKNEKLVSF